MTLAKYMAEYRELLILCADWAKDSAKLDRYMAAVQTTANQYRGGGSWHCSGVIAETAWANIGGKGRLSLAKLRALPKE